MAELYARHVPAGMRLAFLLTGNRQQAEDLVQEAFIRCVGRFRHLRVPDAFEAYFRRARTSSLPGCVRRWLERAFVARHGAMAPSVRRARPATGAREDLWRRLQALPERQRAVLLRFSEALSDRDRARSPGAPWARWNQPAARGGTRSAPRDRDGER